MPRALKKVMAKELRRVLEQLETQLHFSPDMYGLRDAKLIAQMWERYSVSKSGDEKAKEIHIPVLGRSTITLYLDDYYMALSRIEREKLNRG